MEKIILLFIFSFGMNSFSHAEENVSNSVNSNLSQSLSNFVNQVSSAYNISNFFESLNKYGDEGNECVEQFNELIRGTRNADLWAIYMLDASAKLQSGILYGNLFNFGNYDECLEVKHDYQNASAFNKTLKGQYCNAHVYLFEDPKATEFIKTWFGLCVPSACNAQDLQNIAARFSTLYPEFEVLFHDEYCSSEDTVTEIPTKSIIGITVFSIFGLMVLIGTVTDICNLNIPILKCFSAYSNGKKLLKVSHNENALECLNGIRVLSMFLIVLGHRLIVTAGMPSINQAYALKWENLWYNYFFIGLGFSVDTFFVVSGLLVVYLYFRTIDKGRDVPWGMYYIHRLIRLTPSLAMMVLLYSTMLNLFEQQPLPYLESFFGTDCTNYWWTTMLYIQNYWNPNNLCVVQSWYLAIDTHLYFLAPIFLISLKKYPKETIWAMIILTCLSMAAAFEITWQLNLGATFLNQGNNEYANLYTPTHIRITPWLLGALTGYFIAKTRDKTYKLDKVMVYGLWILIFATLIFVLLIQQAFHNTEYNFITSGLFNAFARTIWSMAICGLVWLCVTGNGGLINSFLSCSIFNILIRINYAVYIVQLLVIFVIAGGLRSPIYLSDFVLIHEAFGDYVIILFIAFIWVLMFESPIIGLEKIIFSKGNSKKDENFSGNLNEAYKHNCETVETQK